MRFLIKLALAGLFLWFLLGMWSGLQQGIVVRYAWMIPSRPIF